MDEPREAAAETEETEETEERGLVEDPSYIRVSAYGIASLALGMLAVFRVPGGLTRLLVNQGAQQYPVWNAVDVVVSYFAVPIAAAAIAIYLAGRGEDEIVLSAGRIGGLGLCRSGRWVGYAALVLCTIVFVGALIVGDRLYSRT